MPQPMSRKEQALAALNFQAVPSVPVVGGRIRHLPFLLEALELEEKQFWTNPQGYAIAAADRLGAHAVFGPAYPIEDSPIGANMHIEADQAFSSPEDVLAYIEALPDAGAVIDQINAEDVRAQMLRVYEEGYRYAADMLFIPFGIGDVAGYQGFYDLFGMENFLMAMVLYPEEMESLFRHSAAIRRARNAIAAQAILDARLPRYLWFGHDICDNKGPMVSPQTLDSLYFPHAAWAMEPLREAGIRVIWHSDGNIMPIAKSLLDIVGVDGFQGFQTELGVDYRALGAMTTRRGEKPLLVGGVSNQTLMFGSAQDIRREAEAFVQYARERGGGCLLAPSCSSGPEIPAQSLAALYGTDIRR